MKIELFQRKPMKGDKVKIYQKFREPIYGKVEDTFMFNYETQVNQRTLSISREIMNLKPISEVENINEVDYFLDEDKVRFIE